MYAKAPLQHIFSPKPTCLLPTRCVTGCFATRWARKVRAVSSWRQAVKIVLPSQTPYSIQKMELRNNPLCFLHEGMGSYWGGPFFGTLRGSGLSWLLIVLAHITPGRKVSVRLLPITRLWWPGKKKVYIKIKIP